MKFTFSRVFKAIVVLIVGIAIGIASREIAEHRFSKKSYGSPIMVAVDHERASGIVNIFVTNTTNHSTQVRIGAASFSGIVYLVYADGFCVKLATRDYWNQLMTGPGLCKEVRMRPGEVMNWSMRLDDLVDLRGVKAGQRDKEIVACFCWLDADFDQQKEYFDAMSVVDFSGKPLQAFEAQ